MRKILPLFLLIITGLISYFLLRGNHIVQQSVKNTVFTPTPAASVQQINTSPLAILTMRQKSYPGSNIIIEQTLQAGPNYNRYLVSYQSQDLKIYGLLTIPSGSKPPTGWPVILFNHGYIPPAQYSTASSYASMVEPLASAGYLVFKPDYRGNGNSEGIPTQIYISPDYVIDSMNALASIKKYIDADPNRIGVFGHSMGGNITLHQLVISQDFKAAEIISGVVGDETAVLNWWNQRIAAKSITGNDLMSAQLVQQIVEEQGIPSSNPNFWNTIDPIQYIPDIVTPIQIQVGTSDKIVPPSFSSSLRDKLQNAGKAVDYHEYPGADHNLSPDTFIAMLQTVSFFNKYLK